MDTNLFAAGTCGCAMCQAGFSVQAFAEGVSTPESPRADFDASGTWRWGPSATVGTSGGVVTYSFVAGGVTALNGGMYAGASLSMEGWPIDYLGAARDAMAAWAQVSDIRFIEVMDEGGELNVGRMGDIRIALAPTLGGNILGRAQFAPYQGSAQRSAGSGDVVMSADFAWTYERYYQVVLHEVGHALGLGHSSPGPAVMTPIADWSIGGTGPFGTTLQQDDINGVRFLYGAGPFSGALSYTLPTGQGPMTLVSAVAGLSVLGNAVGNAITGTLLAESFNGADGDDTLRGAAGADTLIGGLGYDVASYAGAAVPVAASLHTNSGWSGDAAGDVFTTIESLLGSSLADFLEGSDDHNIIEGGAGADSVLGRVGNDWISFENAGAGIAVNLDSGSGWAGDATGDSITGIENIRGSRHGDYLFGDWQSNILRGDEGGDVLYGAANSDTIYYSTSPLPVRVDLSTNSATGGHAEGDTLVSVENVFATPFNDTLIGDSASNTLVGWFGVDTMTGNGSNDIFRWTSLSDSGTVAGARDIVTDFYRVHGDLLDLSGIDADAFEPGDQAFIFRGTDFAVANSVRYRHEAGNTIVELAANSFAVAMAFELVGVVILDAQDFVL